MAAQWQESVDWLHPSQVRSSLESSISCHTDGWSFSRKVPYLVHPMLYFIATIAGKSGDVG